MTSEKQFARAKAIAVLECMAIDLIGSLAGLKEANPMTDVLNQRLDAIDVAQEALRERPRWISVEERLPEESGRYIVLRKSGDCLDCCYEKERDSWGVLIDMGEAGALWVAYNGVTHWMPLPEPPEVEV